MQVTSNWLVLLPCTVYLAILSFGLWFLSTCTISRLKSSLYGIIGFGVISVSMLFYSHQSYHLFYANLLILSPIVVFPILIASFRLTKDKRHHKNGI